MNSQTPLNQVTAWIAALLLSGGLFGGLYGLLKSMEPRRARSLVNTEEAQHHADSAKHDEQMLDSNEDTKSSATKHGAKESSEKSNAHGESANGKSGHSSSDGDHTQKEPTELTEEDKAALKMDHETVQARREHSSGSEAEPAVKEKSNTEKTAKWAYEGKSGVYNWGKLSEEFVMCDKGTKQSPVDFVNTEKDARLQPIEFHYQSDDTAFENNGHTLRAKYSGISNFIKHGDDKYNLVEIHFHTPSEHYVDGAPYDMEAHLVHQNPIGKLIVVGVLIEVRGRANKIIEKLWQDLPVSVGNRGPTISFNPELLLPKKREFWNYDGSLTTPPCSEGVRWYVMQSPIEMSIRQLDQFQAAYRKNARPPQPLKGRRLLQSRTF